MPMVYELNPGERDRYYQQVYKDFILYTGDLMISCNGIARILRAYIPSGCYTNFRDMLFHYLCMMKSADKDYLDSQLISIQEHSNRTIRDAEVALCIRCVSISRLLMMNFSFPEEVSNGLRRYVEELADCVLRLRMGSMMLDGMEILRPSVEDFRQLMEGYFKYIEEHAEKEFREIFEYINELKKHFGEQLRTMFDGDEADKFRRLKAFTSYNDVANIIYESVYKE